MNARRKHYYDADGSLLRVAPKTSGKPRNFSAQAYDYDGDVSQESLQAVRDRAKVVLDKEQWVVIDGYVGDEK